MNRLRRGSIARTISMGAIACTIASSAAWAQEGESVEEVVVTGSRIATDSAISSASPVQVLGGEQIRTGGQVDMGELLRETPALNQSLPANFSALQDPAAGQPGSTDSDLGIGFLNLRGLGTVRTLVLVNGRRHVAGAQGAAAVDINTIPNTMVKQVETLTGGASSVYGADAVTGVVNFILRDGSDFDGIEFSARSGVSGRSDAEEYLLSAAGGFEFADSRGDVVFGIEYLRNNEVFDFDRDFTGPNIGNDINNTPEIAAATGLNPDAARVFVRPAGNPISSPLGVFDLSTIDSFGAIDSFISGNPSGTPVPFFPGTNIPILQVIDSPTNGVPRAYDPGLFSNTSQSFLVGDGLGTDLGTLLPQQDRVVANLNASFEVNEALRFFVESKYAYSKNSERQGVADFNDAIPIAYDNPFIPAALAAQIEELQGLGIIGPNPNDGTFYGFGSSRDTSDLAVLPRTTVERDTVRVVVGIDGDLELFGGMNYEVSYNYGKTDVEVNNEGTRLEDRFYAALDTVVDPATGEIVCRSDLDPTALPWVGATFPTPEFSTNNFSNAGQFTQFVSFQPGDGSCVPFNPFGRNAATEEYADFVYVNAVDTSELQQNVVFASLAGTSTSLFELPAGPVGWVVGLEYREEQSEFIVSDEELSLNTWNGSNGNARLPLAGDFDVFEYFVELQAPLLEDLPGIQYLELTGAARFADYSTIGTNTAWSVGGRWSPVGGLTFRSTYSEAVRAPNIAELFSPQQPAFYPFLDDPCSVQNIDSGTQFRADNCAQLVPDGYDVTNFITAGIPGVTGGNPDLSQEEATTFTVGLVWQPDLLPGLRMIVDYYDIEIESAIGALSALRISQACVDLSSTDNQFCPLIQRAPEGFITFHQAGQVNLGALETSGIDFGLDYTFSLGRYGDLFVGVTGTHLLDFREFQDPIDQTVFEDRVEEFGFPDWIMNFSANWRMDKFSLGWAARLETSQLLPTIQNAQVDADPLFVDPLRTGNGMVHDFNLAYAATDKINVYGGINNAFDEDPYLGSLARPAGPRGRFMFAGVTVRTN
ncbi:MAG: TonB-dependent receptor [Pseudomonadota bacterium]